MGKKGGGRVRVKQVGPKMPATINPLADLAIPPEEMIHLPVQPDSNSGFLFWPMSEFPSIDGYHLRRNVFVNIIC